RTLAKGSICKGTPVKGFSGDGTKILATTERPFSALPAYLVHYSAAISAPASFDSEGKAITVIGTGFYRMTSFKEGKIIDFEGFDKYWGGKPAINEARYFAVSNPETRVLLAESGEGDIVVDIPAEAALRLRENKNLTVISDPLPRVRLLTVNSALPFFSNAKVRSALSYLIDRESITTALLKNSNAAATQLFPPVSAWHNKIWLPLPTTLKKAEPCSRRKGGFLQARRVFLQKTDIPSPSKS
ncbi:MAG: ABC transporter substrate-binding protein, partial [Aminobacterium colombiense]|nr:ABC transporter substrate-binding protein [Aminobacterium colombiense]